jgi:hypothetical protein
MEKQKIQEYLNSLSINEGNISLAVLRSGLITILGYEPGINVVWDQTKKLNESNEQIVVDEINEIKIVFGDVGDLNFVIWTPNKL